MKRWTTMVVALALAAMAAGAAVAQDAEPDRALREAIEERFDVVPLSSGLGLTPKSPIRDVRLIEVSDGAIAVNGVPVTGRELRERVGEDTARAILRLTYLTDAARRELFTADPTAAAPVTRGREPREPREPRAEPPDEPRDRSRRSRGPRVRIFGDVRVDEGERIDGEVVAVLGSVRVDGEVSGEVVAVLGSVDLGPKAVVQGDVVAVGGRIRRAATAELRGAVTEVSMNGLGGNIQMGPWAGPWAGGWGFDALPRLLGSTFRVLLILVFGGLAYVVARGAVEGSAQRVSDNVPKAFFVGLAAELLTLPLLALTTIVLAITIVGIPLLALLPFVLIALVLMALAGFTGTASALGAGARRRFAFGSAPGFADVILGVLLILSPLLLGRLLDIAGTPVTPLAWLLIVTGVAVEFFAWTTGFGAALINTFSRWRARRVTHAPPPAAA